VDIQRIAHLVTDVAEDGFPFGLTEQALDRILAVLDGDIPVYLQQNDAAYLHRRQLARDLAKLYVEYLSREVARGSTTEKKIVQAIKTARKLRDLLEEIPLAHAAYGGLIAALDAMIAEATWNRPPIDPPAEPAAPQPGSAFEWLAGGSLPQLYETNFGEKATYTKSAYTGASAGRYIQFCEAVLREMKITIGGAPYSPKTIANALDCMRAGKKRRK
jgi:hypothetical protein